MFSLWRKARRENSAASRLLGSTSLRFALHGWQRMNKLQLPPGISVKRRGNAYAIFRNEYEEIGGVVVRGTSLGDTQLQPYVEEPQEKNRQIVALVAQQMSDALLVHVAKKPAHLRRNAFPPNNVSTGTEVFENKVFPCTKCNQIIAKLVFSWESASVAASHGE
ncbi:hypothetical protein, partial [Thiolapillus sp.]